MLNVKAGSSYNHHLLQSAKALTVTFISGRCFCRYIKLTDLIQIQPNVGSKVKPQIKARGVTFPWLGASSFINVCLFHWQSSFDPWAKFIAILHSCNLHIIVGFIQLYFYTCKKKKG
jgi:hypothetical protein